MDLKLGIDFGSTSVKITFLDKNLVDYGSWLKRTNAYNSHCYSCNTDLTLNKCNSALKGQSNNPCQRNIHDEQNCVFILNALRDCLLQVPLDIRRRVTEIVVCGQMHGVVLWKQKPIYSLKNMECYDPTNFSPLFTWQDKRCDRDFIDSLPNPNSHLNLASGFACTTITHLQEHAGEWLKDYKYAGSIMDLFVSLICDIELPVTSPQIAASWGYFNTQTSTWNFDILQCINFPVKLLPEVRKTGSIVGKCIQFLNVGQQNGAKVFVAIGDMQCSVLASLQDAYTAVINIGTSSQMSTVMSAEFQPTLLVMQCGDLSCTSQHQLPVQYFPFFGGRYLRVAASLNGGNVLEAFTNFVHQAMHDISMDEIWSWLTEIDEPFNQESREIFNKTQMCIHQSIEHENTSKPIRDQQSIDESCYKIEARMLQSINNMTSTILVERHQPQQQKPTNNNNFASMETNPKRIIKIAFYTLCHRVIDNLIEMFGELSNNISMVRCCGNALLRNRILRQAVVDRLKRSDIDMVNLSCGDAARGSVLSICPNYISNILS